jgi:oxygen-dependent protoporphyrinogen oxidase
VASESQNADVLVVGAGIAGLTAAHHLREQGRDVVVLEADAVPGGRVRTEEWDGCHIELGGVYMAARYDELMRLTAELGLEDELRDLPNAFRTAVRRDGDWSYADYAHTPNPFTRARDFARFSAVSWRDRASVAKLTGPMARVAARRARFYDVASGARVDRAALQDVVAHDAARFYVSPLIEVFCGYRLEEIGLPMVVLAADPPGKALTPRAGMGSIPAALAARLDVRCGQRVTRVETGDGGVSVAATGPDGAELEYRATGAVVATPADVTLDLWPGAPAAARAFLASTEYSDGFVHFVRTREPFQKADPRGNDLYMEVIPPEPGRALHAVVFANFLAHDGGGLVALSASPDARARGDEELAAALEAELVELHPELSGAITGRRPVRAERVVPRFPSGRARELAEFRSSLEPGPVQLAGDYLYGACMESAAQAGMDAAGRLPRGQSPAAASPSR